MKQKPDALFTPNAAGGKVAKPVGNARDDRLKAALKANMARRKAQAKARAGQPGPDNEKD